MTSIEFKKQTEDMALRFPQFANDIEEVYWATVVAIEDGGAHESLYDTAMDNINALIRN